MQHNRVKYQENIAEELKNSKIEIPNTLDKDLENKIKELEASKPNILDTNNKGEDFHTL